MRADEVKIVARLSELEELRDGVGVLNPETRGNPVLNRTKIFIERPNKYKPRKDAIRLTGRATAGTITALRFPKNK